jgi:hypothetical protein
VTEIDRLRDEVAQLRATIASYEAENATLHRIVTSMAVSQGRPATSSRMLVQIGSRERMAMLEHAVDVLEGFAHNRASYDCYGCEPDSKCEPCQAEEALAAVKAYRYGGSMEEPSRRFVGAMDYRVHNDWNPREAKIHRAWVGYMERYGSTSPDRTLGMILTDRQPGQPDGVTDWPTPRDWYVATSIVQWLVTNCGSSILEAAGWKYTQWDEDRKQLDDKRANAEQHA